MLVGWFAGVTINLSSPLSQIRIGKIKIRMQVRDLHCLMGLVIANFQSSTKNDLGDGASIMGVGQKQTYSN